MEAEAEAAAAEIDAEAGAGCACVLVGAIVDIIQHFTVGALTKLATMDSLLPPFHLLLIFGVAVRAALTLSWPDTIVQNSPTLITWEGKVC